MTSSSRAHIPRRASEAPPADASDFAGTVRTVPPLTETERATLAALACGSRPSGKGDHVVRVEDVAAVIGTDDAAGVAAAVFPLVGRRTERPPGHRDGEWSAVALVSGVRVHGALCHVEWGPGMRPWLIGLPSVDRARLADFGLTDAQVDEAAGLASRHGTERVERNLAYVEAELARGKEIEALGAYVYRAIQGDWAGRASAATRKRDAVRRAAAAQWETTRKSIFPPPALRARPLRSAGTQRSTPVPNEVSLRKTASQCEAGRTLQRGLAPRGPEAPGERKDAQTDAACAGQTPGVADAALGRSSRALLLVALVAAVAGCTADRGQTAPGVPAVAPASAAALPADLIGVWDLAEVPVEFGECHEASIGYRADGRYVTKSGRQIVTGQFSAESASLSPTQAGSRGAPRVGYIVVQRPEAHNGRPNCQGFPADVAVAQSPRTAFVEVARGADGRPDEARVYFDAQAVVPAVVLVRRTSGG